jgi:hypothetical protein
MVSDKRLLIASKEFLIEDIYIMNKLKLRPGKQDMDRRRLTKLVQMYNVPTNTINRMYKQVKPIIEKNAHLKMKKNGRVSITRALAIDPYDHEAYTSRPSMERLSKQLVYGLRTIQNNTTVNGYVNTTGNKRFNLNTLKWVNTTNNAYVRNEYNLRPNTAKPLPNKINVRQTLYGYNPVRDAWIPEKLVRNAAAIPYVGLKKRVNTNV